MANMIDYVEWRGDLTFLDSPFNNIDNLIFTELSFLDFSNIAASDFTRDGIILSDAVDAYFERFGDTQKSLGAIISDDIKILAKKMRTSRRFKDLRISSFINITDKEKQMQFCAMTVILPDDSAFIAFRGTDDTIVGWREDFNMMFTFPVPAQIHASDYVSGIMSKFEGDIRIGGHSKGGNLAIYSAACCPKEYRHRILKIYNNDGPGFGREMLESEGYIAIKNRIVMNIPQASVVGMLFEHEKTFNIVKSNATGILQHEGFSWEVLGTDFVPFDSLTRDSVIVDKTIRSIVSQMDAEESKKFVNAMFEILGASNADTLTDLMKNKSKLIRSMKNVPAESRDLVLRTILKMIGESGHVWLSTVKSRSEAERIRRVNKRTAKTPAQKSLPPRSSKKSKTHKSPLPPQRIK